MDNSEKILILDANQRSALAATRSLGKAGLFVVCADEPKKTLAGASKYARRNLTYPSPYTERYKFIDHLASIINSLDIRYLLPMTDITAEVTLKNKARFRDVIILLPDYDSYMSISDKYQLMNMALAKEIPIPRTQFINTIDELLNNTESIKYPVVIKPSRSIITIDGEKLKTTVKYANTKDELVDVVNQYPWLKENQLLVQEYIAGHGEGLFVLCKEGKIQYYFSHKRLREKPPSGGVSVLSESIDTRDERLEIAKNILGPIKWNGVAMVEFKVTKDNKPYLMEVNGRFWGSLQLAIDAGVDFPFLLYKQFSTVGALLPVCEYKKGIQLRWLLGDVDNLIITLKNFEVSVKTKLISIVNFLRLYRSNQFYEVNRFDDIGPAIHEFINYFKR
jgi:predicted ATP-grasp superfamily ATP-dependent carboligase